jgi:hypothetical protein
MSSGRGGEENEKKLNTKTTKTTVLLMKRAPGTPRELIFFRCPVFAAEPPKEQAS